MRRLRRQKCDHLTWSTTSQSPGTVGEKTSVFLRLNWSNSVFLLPLGVCCTCSGHPMFKAYPTYHDVLLKWQLWVPVPFSDTPKLILVVVDESWLITLSPILFPRRPMKHPTLRPYPCQEPLKRKSKKASDQWHFLTPHTVFETVLVGGDWNMAGWLFHLLGISSSQPTNSIIFRRGRSTTNQLSLGHVFQGLNSFSERIWGGFMVTKPTKTWVSYGSTWLNHSSLLVCLYDDV